MTVQRIVKAVANANLEYSIYKSQKLDKIFMKIRAEKTRLNEEADRTDYQLLLDEKEVKERIQTGTKVGTAPSKRPSCSSSSRALPLQDPSKAGQDYIYSVFPRRDGWEFMGEEMRTAIAFTLRSGMASDQ